MNSVFKALNDPTRREILELLQQRDMTAGEIVDQFNISGPSISHHLDLLKQAGLVLAGHPYSRYLPGFYLEQTAQRGRDAF